MNEDFIEKVAKLLFIGCRVLLGDPIASVHLISPCLIFDDSELSKQVAMDIRRCLHVPYFVY